MKKILLALVLTAGTYVVQAQDATATKTFWQDPFNDPMMPLYVVSAIVFLVVLLVITVALYMVKMLNLMVHQAAVEKAAKEGKVYVPQPSMWDRLTQSLNQSVPVAQEKDIDLGHDFDGIRELDNHLPPWWTYLFYATIGWSVIYLIIYHVSYSLPLSTEEYANAVAEATQQSERLKASQPAAVIDLNTLVYKADAAIIEKGKSVFKGNNCGSCHGADGGGNTIGPNLTDEYWIHGGGIKNVFATINTGAVDKGMPAWGKSMKQEDVRDVAFYVMSLQGTKPANPKAPQGELYKEVVSADTTKVAAAVDASNP